MTKRFFGLIIGGGLVAALAIAALAFGVFTGAGGAGGNKSMVKADPLTGYQEATPAGVSSSASGTFSATIDDDASPPTISYTLTYVGLTGPALFLAHPLRQPLRLGRRLRLPVRRQHQAGVPGRDDERGDRDRHDHSDGRHRPGQPGHRAGRLRQARRRDPLRRDVRERPHADVPGRRDPRPDQQRRPASGAVTARPAAAFPRARRPAPGSPFSSNA